MPLTDEVDEQIRSVISELMNAAPPSPSLSELEGRDWEHESAQTKRTRRVRHVPRLAALGGTVAVGLAALLIVVFMPSAGQHEPVAAAAQLQQIASNAASQAAPQLTKGQWLSTEQQVSLSGQVNQIGATPTPGAEATVAATVRLWSDAYGNDCISATTGPATFATPANQTAWHAAGMVIAPTVQPVTSCTSSADGGSAPIGFGGATGTIDASALPTDPVGLARELVTGTTPIPALNQMTSDGAQASGFERAVVLLIGPVAGGGPALDSALYGALALMPGIQGLGTISTHTGATGVGFSGTSPTGTSVIIVDPSTGSLLEARDVPAPSAYMGIGAAYLASPPTPSLDTEGGVAGISIRWIDPTGTSTVVPSSALPGDLSVPQQVTLSGKITATAKLAVPYSQLEALQTQLAKEYGLANTSGYSAPSSVQDTTRSVPVTLPGGAIANVGAVLDWTFVGSTSQVSEYAMALRSSGLFTSVVVTDMHGSS